MSQLLLNETAAPGTPAAAKVVVYVKSDGLVYAKDDAGVETQLSNVGLGGITLGTPQNSTSGSSINFTGIPVGTKQITVSLVGVSLSSTSNPLFQIGDSGGLETSGYLGGGSNIVGASTSSANYTTGFGINSANAAAILHGSLILTLVSSAAFTWSALGIFHRSDSAVSFVTSGTKSLTAELDRLSILSTGADTFDAGVINIAYA